MQDFTPEEKEQFAAMLQRAIHNMGGSASHSCVNIIYQPSYQPPQYAAPSYQSAPQAAAPAAPAYSNDFRPLDDGDDDVPF